MRPYLMAVSALLLVAPFAGAQSQAQQDYPRTDSTPVSTVEVTAPPQGIIVTSGQAESIKGTYEMSNGWHLKAQPLASTHGMIAQIDQQPPMRLIALPGDKFVTADGNVAMEFSRGAFKDEMTMSYVPTSNVPGDSTDRITVASR